MGNSNEDVIRGNLQRVTKLLEPKVWRAHD